ncbi:MAG: serine/threonine-protein kinase, partial [Gemmatimonadales bacterium]
MTGKPKPRQDPILPETIGEHYAVGRVLGRGGMATVYLCTDTRDGSRVAVKVLRQEIGSAVIVERFLREIDLASALDHPRIPAVIGSGQIGELPFYVMTYVEGESLRAHIDRVKQLPIPDAIRITAEITDAMTYAHASGIVHRDLKPDNILLSSAGAVVLDFGVARAIIESAGDRLTSTGVAIGTPAYMSPEQALADKDLDARSDIYSLGCVTYEMIAGIPPFVGATPQAIITRRFVSSAPPLSETREGVPPEVERAVAKALMRSPLDRWQTAEQFTAALTSSERLKSSRFAAVANRIRKRRRLFGGLIGIPVAIGAAVIAALLSGLVPDAFRPRHDLDHSRIAVLYFDDHSPDDSLGYLASGLTESLIHELSSVPALQVISRNGVKPFRDHPVSMDSLSRALRVGTVVEGSVQRSGNRIRVTAQIVDAESDRPIQGATIEHAADDIFKLEDDLAHEVASMLRRRLGKEVKLRATLLATSSSRARELTFRADEARDNASLLLSNSDSGSVLRGLAVLREADKLLARAETEDPKWTGPLISRGWIALDAARKQGGSARIASLQQAWGNAQRALNRTPGNPNGLELRGTILYFRAARLPLPDKDVKQTLIEASSDLYGAITI